jgi:TonB family protein
VTGNRRVLTLFSWAGLTLLRSVSAYAQADASEAKAPSEAAKPDGASEATEKGTSGSTSGTGSPSRVVRPELVEFAKAAYPEGARAEQLEADVPLELTVEPDGSVSAARVTTPQGHGFDEAAVEAAQRLRFSPATVDGVPRRVRIAFLYPFRLDPPGEAVPLEAAPAAGASAEVAPSRAEALGALGGRILLSGPDSPLPGVSVVVTDALGNTYRAETDANGRWRMPGLAPGAYSVTVQSPGFEVTRQTEDVAANELTDLTYRMVAEAAANEIIVRGERPPREVTKRTLERREIERIPGTSGDAIRSIQSLPGVARPPGLAGLLIVRGSAPQDTGYFVDGTAVPLIYHFGGLSSVIPTELLDRIDFYPGNFSTKYGRVMGGIVDAGMRAPNTDCTPSFGKSSGKSGCFHGLVQVDLIDARFLVQGPLAKNWSFAAAGRRSYVDSWLKPVLENAGSSVTSAPVYYDYQLIVDHRPRPGEKLSLRFFGSDDRFETIITSPSASEPGLGGNLRFGTAFTRGQIVYQKELTKKASLDTQLSVGTDSIDFGLGGNAKFSLESVPVYFRSEFGYKFINSLRMNLGLDFAAAHFDVFVRSPPAPRPGEGSPGPFVTRPPRETQQSGVNFRPGWYTDLEWQPSSRLRLVPGVRLDFASDSKRADLSPRLSARYVLLEPEDNGFLGPRRTTLKAGIGRYAQPPQFQETDPVLGTPNLKSNIAYHYTLGLEQQVTDQVDLTVDGFYKDMINMVTRAPNQDAAYTYGNSGTGSVIGMETMLKYRADDRFFGWVAYTLSESIRQSCATCAPYLFQYDQTHNLIVLGSYRLGRGWEFGARFRIVSGPLDTPTNSSLPLPALFAGDAGSYVALSGAPYSERLPLFHQLDIRIDKRWQFEHFRLNAYLDVQNVYNNAARESYVYNFNYSERAYQTGLPILPSLGLRGEF